MRRRQFRYSKLDNKVPFLDKSEVYLTKKGKIRQK